MTKRIVYAMDDPAYKGGAHIATLAQLVYVHQQLGYEVVVLSLAAVSNIMRDSYPFVHFIDPTALYGQTPPPQNDDIILEDLTAHIRREDVVCVPFENSRFRQAVSKVHCRRKVQWVHIDYAHWRSLNSWTQSITAQDGELYRRFDRIVFISKMSRDGFVALYPHLRDRCRVCHNLMDSEKILSMASEALFPDAFTHKNRMRLVTVARLEDQQKAIGRCLLLAQRLRDKGLDFEWVFVGDGTSEDMRMYRQYVKQTNLSDNIVFTGAQNNPFAYVRRADMFCLFSYYEGIPNTIFESLIVGTPVAATRVGATAEQIPLGTGWLFENNSHDIFHGLANLLENPEQVQAAKEKLIGYQYDNTSIQKTIATVFDGGVEEEQTMEPLVSVIVPVYNVQDYLDQCLDSLANQTLKNIEVLVVNDGSTDQSGAVIDKYVQQYPETFYRFDKENGGPGGARNYGSRFVRSEYIAFVDGDDFVELDMIEQLYSIAIKHQCDIVQADLRGFNNNIDYQAIERTPFGVEGFVSQKDLMIHSTRPVVASPCTKLYRKALFDRFQFPDTWYEDLCLLPIIYSYTNRLYYFPHPLYNYRWEREGSIQTQKATSPRTLEILQSQQRILEQCNPLWRREAEYAVYEHTCRFLKGTPVFSTQTIEFVHRNAVRFLANDYIQKAIAADELPNLLPDAAVIPPVIHCFDFGLPPSPLLQKCRDSWTQFMPEHTIKTWCVKDFDLAETPFLQRAWMSEDYAAVAGYLAIKVLQREGGIYLDPGVELNVPLDTAAGYPVFMPWAGQQLISWEVMGAAPGHALMQDILSLYAGETYRPNDFFSIRHNIWTLLHKNYGLIGDDTTTRLLAGGIALYPAEKLLIDVGTNAPLAQHRYDGYSNCPKQDFLRHQLERQYYLDRYQPKESATECPEESFTGNPYEIVDSVVHRYGILFMLRGICKRIFAVVFPVLYRRLEKSKMDDGD